MECSNYRKVKLPDCCYVCKHKADVYEIMECYQHDHTLWVSVDHVCDKFERDEEHK
jgi:hypothetical protein